MYFEQYFFFCIKIDLPGIPGQDDKTVVCPRRHSCTTDMFRYSIPIDFDVVESCKYKTLKLLDLLDQFS